MERHATAFDGRTQWCKIMGRNLNVPRERRADGEGKHARRRNQKSAVFTHFLTHKFTLLSRVTVLMALLSLRFISLTQHPHATPMDCIQANQSNVLILNTMCGSCVTELQFFRYE